MPPDPDPRLMDLYKLAVEMADRVSARRMTANTFYASLQSAIVATLGLLASMTSLDPWVLVAGCIVGMVASVMWYAALRTYRELNKVKFEVIARMEEELELPVKVFTDEWTCLQQRRRYLEFGRVERVIPWLFIALDLALAFYLGT